MALAAVVAGHNPAHGPFLSACCSDEGLKAWGRASTANLVSERQCYSLLGECLPRKVHEVRVANLGI